MDDGLIERAKKANSALRKELLIKRAFLIFVIGVVGIAVKVALDARRNVDQMNTAPVVVQSAGILRDIKAFNVYSTVITSVGIYQVYGAVSGSVGDQAELKTKLGRSELCVYSKIKTLCYGLR